MARRRHLAEQDDLSTYWWPSALGNMLPSFIRLPPLVSFLEKLTPKLAPPLFFSYFLRQHSPHNASSQAPHKRVGTLYHRDEKIHHRDENVKTEFLLY